MQRGIPERRPSSFARRRRPRAAGDVPRSIRALVAWLFLGGCAALLSGCLRKDYPAEGPVVAGVDLLGADAVDPDEVLDGLSTAASPRFLGIWDGVVFEYEVYEETLLARDLERIERYYRARGYYDAKVEAARIVRVDERRVRVEIRVREGDPVRTRRVQLSGIERLPMNAAAAALRAVTLTPGEPFDERRYEASKKAIVDALANRGYAFVRVDGRADVDLAQREAVVHLTVEPGPPAVYGPVTITGLDQIPEDRVRSSLGIVEGETYSKEELEDARETLIALGVFANVDLTQDTTAPETRRVPITVAVQESALRTLRLGGGTRFDVLAWESHLRIGWEHRNFLGGMRRLTMETAPGLVFFPTRIDNFVAPTAILPKNRARIELRQPAFLEGRTTGFVAGEFNIYPLLYPDLGLAEDENVIGFREVRAQTGLERPFFGHRLLLSPVYNWQANFPFAYIGGLEEGLDTVVVSVPEVRAILDLRDNPIDPRRGFFLSSSVQVAGHVFGGDASDVKIRPEARAYVPISKSVTLATRATVGFVFPSNYGATLRDPTLDPTNPAVIRDQQLLLFRAFYSGGPNSNRGYPFRGVGPHGPLGFLVPSNVNCAFDDDRPVCQRPLGGLTLWEASAEIRFPLVGPLRGAVFLDASDVNREVAKLRFDFPHLAAGFGLRYQTPVGPVRVDVGYRLPLPQRDREPNTIGGLPIAIHFGLGEAF